MNTPIGQKRQGRIVLLILLIAIALDKCWMAKLMPRTPVLLGVNPMLVFLDIPVDMSLTVDLVAVMGLFILFYAAAIRSRVWRTFTSILAVPCCTLSGGLLYLLAHDHLPKHARNAIESVGINIDLYTFYPGHELIHLRGSMIMLVCSFIGMHICIRRIRSADSPALHVPPVQEPAPIPV